MSGGQQSGSVGGEGDAGSAGGAGGAGCGGRAGCAARLVVAGRVQGVGFRWFTQRAADALRLSGWVRNRRDGTVEAEVIGERAAVETCIGKLREGPPGSAVDRLDVEWKEAPSTSSGAEPGTSGGPAARGERVRGEHNERDERDERDERGARGAGMPRRFEIRATL